MITVCTVLFPYKFDITLFIFVIKPHFKSYLCYLMEAIPLCDTLSLYYILTFVSLFWHILELKQKIFLQVPLLMNSTFLPELFLTIFYCSLTDWVLFLIF